jgi:hypothetical protein
MRGFVPRSIRTLTAKMAVAATAGSLIVASAIALSASPALSVGTSSNTISASTAPSAGSTHGTYSASAQATSKDIVAITLSSSSSGCSISNGKVTFTGSGTCVVDFNDAGNSTYAAAPEVVQSIKVYSSNDITVSKAPSAGSTGGSYSPGASATSGDAVVRTLSNASSGCSLSSGTVTFTGAGTCRVDFNDPGNGAFAAASEVQQSIEIYAANLIHTSTAPAAGTINGSYDASASATSGDSVVITLDATSTGCSIAKSDVTFTGNGYCRVDFNDAGNGAFSGAAQVQQVIIVGNGGPKAQAPLYLTSLNGTKFNKLTLTSSGGSGSGAVSYTATSGTAGCTISGNVLSAKSVGTCLVTVTKAADSVYAAVQSYATTVTFNLAKSPVAKRVSAAVRTGRSNRVTIIGANFYGQPRIISSARDTKIGVVSDTGSALSIVITVYPGAPVGIHTMKLTFPHGQVTSVLYNQR